ncbi:hypothetical protein E1301_Tti009829 [Triplophysa tibetana]|uniref:Uncharacterized protein n=1 Tax=Triplophysa tibetana TaxID=1572043 RepID=A0A5A9N8K1_9TELE|nr:hypothetical protein E1301_Tti009829 [Triplophysa tibetana]
MSRPKGEGCSAQPTPRKCLVMDGMPVLNQGVGKKGGWLQVATGALLGDGKCFDLMNSSPGTAEWRTSGSLKQSSVDKRIQIDNNCAPDSAMRHLALVTLFDEGQNMQQSDFPIQIVFQKLRSRVAVFLREPATISFATWAVTSVATALMTTHVSSVSDMGNSANVNPPAKCSRADRTPIRSSKRSPTGGGIPSGSSRTHSETMCDVDETSLAASEGDWHPALTNLSSTPGSSSRGSRSDATRANPGMRGSWEASEIPHDVCCPSTQDPFDIGSGSCAPTGGTPVAEVEGETSTPSATFSREGTLTGRPQGGQLRARTFTATALIGRYGTTPASSPKPGPYQGLAPTYSESFPFSPGVLTADRTLHWTVLGEPTSHPGEV